MDNKKFPTMTWLDEIPLEEKACVEELRKRTIGDCTEKMLEDPSLFYRFLRARNFKMKDAEIMLRKHISWRNEYGVDSILSDFKIPEVLRNYMSVGKIGVDKEGSSVFYAGVGKTDINGLVKSCKIDLLKYLIYISETDVGTLQEQSQKTGKLITQYSYIQDFADLTLARATNRSSIELVMQWTRMFQNNYPERMKTLYLINTSVYFSMAFSLVKLIISSGLAEKIRIFGTEESKDALLENIDAEVLPAFLGGKRTDPDGNPLCNSFICHGGIVPKHYYLPTKGKTLQQVKGIKKLFIPRLLYAELIVEVVVPRSVLMWKFETKDKDIKFGLHYKSSKSEDAQIVEKIPKIRIDTCCEPEIGTFVCEEAGSYILVFDNTYSWIFSKEVYYTTELIPPCQD